ncbi:DUF1798 family protein [Aciduricibacillus chroicocephali]|uniref:DUF1798 family protein n=1 Tax=Aciduricibacillus chroicocephali TaxID=3054939 RepID=A0ABY9KZ72_9BACI|nr:DUF1798 family protein [Bacillaceae bacterium 44XB]
MKLLQDTTSLLEHIQRLKNVFLEEKPPADFKDKAFFERVKADANPIHMLLNEWEEEALLFLKANTNAPVHPHQIVSTRENIELIIMHSHYSDVREKRYMELNISVNYVLGILEDYLDRLCKAGAIE